MRWAKREGATQYDFWGIPQTDDGDEAMAGVYRFKAGWGGQVVRFMGGYERVYRPLIMRVARGLGAYVERNAVLRSPPETMWPT